MNQKGFVNILVLGGVVLLVISVGYFAWSKSPIQNEGNPKFEAEIIVDLKSNWQSIQAEIPFRPSHPSTTAWLSPDSVQFISGITLLVRFEDGYNPSIVVLNFDNDQFKVFDTFQNQADFTLSDWQNLVKKYGDSSYALSTYTTSLVRNKEIVSFPDLTKVPENVFVKNYWESATDISNWKTYTNTQYGFEFKYPKGLNLYIVPQDNQKISLSGYIPVCDVPYDEYGTIVCLHYPKTDEFSRFFSGAGFGISLIKDTKIESDPAKNCAIYAPDPKYPKDFEKIKEINGTWYYYLETGGAAAGHQSNEELYRTFKNGNCIQIDLNVTTNTFSDESFEGMKKKMDADDEKIKVILSQILSTFKFTKPATSEATEPEPVIYSVTPSSGPIGTKITIKGKNLNGFEGDLNARIATEFNPADYSSGIMYGERTGSTDTIVTTIESSFCKQDNSYHAIPCKSYFYVTPGVYEISVKPWGKESNSVSFTVTK